VSQSICLPACLSAHLSGCPSALRIEQLGSRWTDFHEILYLNIFRKPVEKIKVPLKSGKNNEYFVLRPMYIYDDVSLNYS
jgi:hypothetical protein